MWLNFGWAQCPEDTTDRGICDTFYVEVFGADSIFHPPYDSVRVALYITHDLLDWIDSIGTIVVPLHFTITNPASGCSLPTWDNDWWNNTTMNPYDPTMPRSIFRHLIDATTGDTIHNRLQDMVAEYWEPWTTGLSIENSATNPDSNWVKMVLCPLSPTSLWWWEGEKVLLATLTFTTHDTTTLCIDSMFWPPSSPLSFWRADGYKGYIPRHNLPCCFRITLPLPVCSSRPGDVNLDWVSDIADVVYLINHLFIGGPPTRYCDCADVNCDGQISTADVIYYINYLFAGGPPLQSCTDCY